MAAAGCGDEYLYTRTIWHNGVTALQHGGQCVAQSVNVFVLGACGVAAYGPRQAVALAILHKVFVAARLEGPRPEAR